MLLTKDSVTCCGYNHFQGGPRTHTGLTKREEL